MRFGNSIPKQKENLRQERPGIRKKQKKLQNSNHFSIVFSGRHTSIHSSTCNPDHNISDSIYYVWTIKIKSFGNKHSNAMH